MTAPPSEPQARTPRPGAPRADLAGLHRAWYESVRYATLVVFGLRGTVRVSGREHLPATTGALIISNHLSFLDVFVLGLGVPRTLNYVARSSLFLPGLGAFIRSVGGFPIDREGGGVGGLKETLRRLRNGQLVLIFPEGTRSRDGAIGPIKPGIAALARARVPFVPAGVAGTFEAYPRTRILPRPHPIWVHFGTPIPADELAALSPEALSERVRCAMLEAQRVARYHLQRLLDAPAAESPEP